MVRRNGYHRNDKIEPSLIGKYLSALLLLDVLTLQMNVSFDMRCERLHRAEYIH